MSSVRFKAIERNDVDTLKQHVSREMAHSIVIAVVNNELEVTMKLGGAWSLGALRNTMKIIPNGTLMARTLNFREHYDGKEYRSGRDLPGTAH